MRVRRKTAVRLAVAVTASAVVLAAGGWANAGGKASSDKVPPTSVGILPATAVRGTAAPVNVASDTSVASPFAWCCAGGSAPGLTVTGEATVRGHGAQARDAAIAKAVADATDQAKTAALAAGVTLGRVVDIQVSAPSYPYPLLAAGGSSHGVVPPIQGIPGSSSCGMEKACPASTSCAPPSIMPVATFVGVTITWAIG